MDAKQKRAFNLRVLKQHDQAVEDILDGTSYAVLYSFVEGVGWKKEMVEGSMFIFTRLVLLHVDLSPNSIQIGCPKIWLVHLSGPDNFITLFTGTDDLQLTGDYIIFRPADEDAIWGVWVFDASHRPRIAKCIEDIEKLAAKEKDQLPAKVDTFVDPAIASMSASPAQPSSSTTVQAGQPLSVDDLFGNFDSPALAATNAVPAASTLPTITQDFNNVSVSVAPVTENRLPQQSHQPQQPQNVQRVQQPSALSYEDSVKADGTQQLLSFLGLPPTATIENNHLAQPRPPQQTQMPTFPSAGPVSQVTPATNSAPAPISLPIDTNIAGKRIQQSVQTPLSEPSVPATPLPLSAVTPSERNHVVLSEELENLKKLTFEDELKKETSKQAVQPNVQQSQQFNNNFPPLGISPPTAPRAERERQQKMMQHQSSSNSLSDEASKSSPGLFNPGIRTHVRTVPKTRKASAISNIQRTSIASPSAVLDNLPPKSEQPTIITPVNGAAQVTEPSRASPQVNRQNVPASVSPQVGLDVITPTLPFLRQPNGQKLDQYTFKQALASLILENDEFLNVLYQRYMLIGQ
ncbi:hypothetical protein E3Q02_00486 [Wallemia mellicola]|uniref:PH domain-like protein n=1 Tax=Wallemia mellicola TaxID=1708541 RepID=A0AB38MZ15_9BASI|nr:hypothetical protein E3Q02_00486 [Wallemia mellicola]